MWRTYTENKKAIFKSRRMNRKIVLTSDGSTTIQIEDWQEQYHSMHGAIQEAKHVFIKHGLSLFASKPTVRILEIGFGTGLNAIISLIEQSSTNNIHYDGVEAFPVKETEWRALNYLEQLEASTLQGVFDRMHESPWNEPVTLTASFTLTKIQKKFDAINAVSRYDLIYFDAFGARVQPELWTEEIFKIMYQAIKTNGVLVTYSAKGSVRRAMQKVGFTVERLPGPPGKREMLRAVKGKITD